MPVVEFVRSTAAEGRSDDLRQALSELIPGFTQHPGCRSSKALQGIDDEDPRVFYLVIEWDSVEAHESWRQGDSDHRRRFVKTVRPLLHGANLVGHFEEFAAG